jgi:anaerobic selenocysteine-containing dehydrogenase
MASPSSFAAIPTIRSRADRCATRSTTISRTHDRRTVCCIRCAVWAPKGSGAFTRISWEEALDGIAERFADVIATHGPEAIWPFLGSGSMGLLQGVYGAGRRLWNVLGTSRHLMTICTIAGGFGTGYTLGDNRVGMDPETLRRSRLVVLWGANVLTTNPHLWRSIAEARANGAKLVVIDPIRTRTAAQSDWHLAPIPGSDAALALGLLHVVLSEGKEDAAFIDGHTLGWPAFRQRILEFPPPRVAAITGLPAESIVALGQELAATRPTGIRIGIGIQRHAGGGMAVRTITCIPGVTGDWRHPGGGVCYDTRGFFGLNWPALWRDDLRTRPARALQMTRLGEGLLDLDDPPVQALLVYASNPMASVPHQNKVRRGLAREDLFTVVVEHFMTDTARFADIVLPATMQTEHRDLLIAYGHMYLAWNEPAAAPPGECLPTTEIFRRLARKMGLDAAPLYDSDETMARQVLDSGHPSLGGITLEELKARGWMRLRYPEPFVPFAKAFPSPSGKLEFVSERMAQAGLDPVAGYTPAHETSQQETALARRVPARARLAGQSLLPELALRQRAAPAAAGRRRDADDPSRRRGAARHHDRRRGARRQRPRVVSRRGRRERSRAPGRRGQHQGTMARLREGRRDDQRHRGRARLGHGRGRGLPRQPRAGRQVGLIPPSRDPAVGLSYVAGPLPRRAPVGPEPGLRRPGRGDPVPGHRRQRRPLQRAGCDAPPAAALP